MIGGVWALSYVVGAFCGGAVKGNRRRGRGSEGGIGGLRATLGRASFGVGTLLVFVLRMDVYMYVHIISYPPELRYDGPRLVSFCSFCGIYNPCSYLLLILPCHDKVI